MSLTKRMIEEQSEENSLIDFLKELLNRDVLEGALAGIAKQTVHQGERSLSNKQKSVLDKYVENFKKNHNCEMCIDGNITTLTDYLFIEENGVCPMCEYDREKRMRD